MFAAGKKVDNLISTIDYNGRQIDGDVDDVMPLGNLTGMTEEERTLVGRWARGAEGTE
mgnify:CR=1 FL=1